MRRRALAVAFATVAFVILGCGVGADRDGAAGAPGGCSPQRATGATSAEIARALATRQDVWGNEVLRAPGGPSYDRARRFLAPLLLARGARGTRLTASGFHYLAFGLPRGPAGTSAAMLHVADGSRIVARRADGPALSVSVGRTGHERYGSCASRLAPPRLASGWLPILATRYVDATGARYEQESFATRRTGSDALVSFVRLRVQAGRTAVRARVEPGVAFDVPAGGRRRVELAWPVAGRAVVIGADEYASARRSSARFWRDSLAQGARISVPEPRVQNALRALLVQNLTLTWRYSLGNAYQEFSFPEGIDVARVMGEHGFAAVDRAMLRTSLTRPPTPYPNWKRGEKLLGIAAYYRLYRDREFVAETTPVLRRYVEELGRQLAASPLSLLARDRYSSDIPDPVYGLHAQAVVWQGLVAMGQVWQETGEPALAATATRHASRLEAGLRRAVRASQRRLRDGSLFVPVRLLDPEKPYGTVTESRAGSYWNLVMPYALASGIFPPGSAEATGIWRYLQRHGSRLLGLVRAGAYALYGRSAPRSSGTDQVYGNHVSRFLADLDEPDQLALTLYGSLAAAMAPGTYVAGEAASVAPLGNSSRRSMYLPPNGAANASFLETLRLLLVHEAADADGVPRGLRLAAATPRGWLLPGRRIEVGRLPTSFGPVSFSLVSGRDTVRVHVDVPSRAAPRALGVRIRLPGGRRVTQVLLAGRPWTRFDPRTEVVDLSGLRGRLDLVVRHAASSSEP